MVHLGVVKMPDAYILRRWTPKAELDPSTMTTAATHGEMPDESRRKMKYAVYCNDLTSLAKVACQSDDGQRILSMHIKQMKTELSALKKRQQRTAAAARSTGPCQTRGPSVSVRKTAIPSTRTTKRQSVPTSHGRTSNASPSASAELAHHMQLRHLLPLAVLLYLLTILWCKMKMQVQQWQQAQRH